MVWLLDPNKLLPLLVAFWSSIGLSHAVRRAANPHQRRTALDIGSTAALTLGIDGAGFLIAHDVAGLIAITAWLLLVVGPNAGGRTAMRRTSRRDYKSAERICGVLAVLRPFGYWNELKAISRAQRWLSEGQHNAGLGLLDRVARSGGELAGEAGLERLVADQRWDELYQLCQQKMRSGSLPLAWFPRFLRAMGETHRTDEIVRSAALQSTPLFASPGVLPHALLVVFAFAGRANWVRRVLDRSLPYLDPTSREAWIGTAEMAAGSVDAGRARLDACRRTADALQLRAIDRRLASPPSVAPELLGAPAQRQIEELAERWQEVQRFVPGHGPESLPLATAIIVGIIVIVFGLEEALGGSTNPSTLDLVGALVPDRVIAGEWWRVFAAVFIHMGPLHLVMNTVALIALGAFVERRLGALATAAVFLASGALPMLAHVALASLGDASPTVGASGGVMGLAGAAGALLARGYFERGVQEARRHLRLLVTLLVVQTAIDLTVPIVDFLGHSLGLAIGFTLGALLCGLRWWRVVLVAVPAFGFSLGMQLALENLPWRPIPCEGEAVLCDQLCDLEFADACHMMGQKYLLGKDVSEDVARARDYFEVACQGKVGDACGILGELVYTGHGGRRDRRRGSELAHRGCELRSGAACKLLEQLCVREHDPTACAFRDEHPR